MRRAVTVIGSGAGIWTRESDPEQTVLRTGDPGPENRPAYRLYQIVTNGPQTVYGLARLQGVSRSRSSLRIPAVTQLQMAEKRRMLRLLVRECNELAKP